MNNYKYRTKRFAMLVLISCLAMSSLWAQYDLKSYFPKDTAVIKGKLSNGLTYYIQSNKTPKARASFYIIRNAGALLEEDHEKGLAHFLEHMAFNGTKHFPKKGIINTLERYGVAFGGNLNAYTSLDETVYNISDVPTNILNALDTCLLVLKDWACYLSLEEDEIDAERGVISEEWRQRHNANFRIRAKTFPVLAKDSKYAERDVIGSLDIINNFNYQSLRDFYYKWYRTDLTAIAIVGDFDAKEMEKKVLKMFAELPAVKEPEPLPFFDIPEHEATYYVVATDQELRNSVIELITLIRNDVKPKDMNYGYYKNSFVESLYNILINRRLGEVLLKPNPPFLSANIGYANFVRAYDNYKLMTVAMPNEEALALKAVLTENERIKRYGFLESELQRAKTNILAELESNYKQKDKIENDRYIGPMKANFLKGAVMMNFEDYYKFAKEIIPTITLQEVSSKAQEWNTKKNQTIVITGPDNHKHLTQKEVLAIIKEVEADEKIAPYKEDKNLSKKLIAEELRGAKVVAEKKLPQFDAVEWTLANGARVVFRKADYEKDRVSLASYSEGGTSLATEELLPAATNAASFVSSFGKGEFDLNTLNKMLAGKLVSVRPSIGSFYESVNGACAPKDFETMMKLVYMTFEQPRFDKTVYENTLKKSRMSLENRYKNPQNVMQDSISLLMSDYHPRALLLNEEYLNSISLERIKQIYTDRIKDASDFIFFIVGNVEKEQAKMFAEKYIGSIKTYNRKETWKDNKVIGFKGKVKKNIAVKMKEPKSFVLVHFKKKMNVTPYNGICLTILKNILHMRYTESIREKEGGTYGVRVSGSSTRLPEQSYAVEMSFNCEPTRTNSLKPLLYAELEHIVKYGPTQEDLDKVLTNMRKDREQSKPHNSYWMNTIYKYYKTGINGDDSQNFEDILSKITIKDIQKWATKFSNQADSLEVTFYPEKESK